MNVCLPYEATELRESILHCLICSMFVGSGTTVAVVQLFLLVVAGVIEVDDNGNGAFGARRGFEVDANVLGGDT